MQVIIKFLLALFIALGASAHGQGMSFDQWERTILEPQLYGGRPADISKGELPHVFWLGFCTFTANSRSAIFGAAHCVDNGQMVSFKTRDGKAYRAKCSVHPQYDDNGQTNNDFALCKLTEDLPADHVLSSISQEIVEPGQKVLIAGYGKPNIGVLHLGESVIRSVGNQDYTTRTPVALGSGDSAGPVFKGPVADLAKGPFVQIAVNSRRSTIDTTSYYNITGLPRSIAWFKKWATENNVALCGINATCGAVVPPVIPERCLADQERVKYFEGELSMAKEAFAACLK